MKELIITLNENDFFLYGFLCGIAFSMISNIITSLINYFDEKALRVRDYERIIDKFIHLGYTADNEELEIINMAKISHNKRLEKRYKLNKFLSKFRRNKDEQ